MTENVLRVSRVFDAPRQLVFSCLVEPEHLTHFWGPIGVSAPRDQITVEAHPGGAFRTVMVGIRSVVVITAPLRSAGPGGRRSGRGR